MCDLFFHLACFIYWIKVIAIKLLFSGWRMILPWGDCKNLVEKVHGDPKPSCQWCLFLKEQTHKPSDPGSKPLVFSFSNSMLVWFMSRKSNFIQLILYSHFWIPGDPFHKVHFYIFHAHQSQSEINTIFCFNQATSTVFNWEK